MSQLNLQHLTFGKDGEALPQERTVIAGKNGSNVKDLSVANDGSLNVTIVSGAGSGGTAMTDDGAFTPGSSSVTPAAGTYRSTRDSVDDGDIGALAISAKRGLYTIIETPAGDSAMDETNDAVRVNIVAGSSSGTQYTEGDTDTTITGTALMWEDGSDTLVAVSAAKPLPVDATLDTTGLATTAKQDTIIGHLDGVEGLLTTIDTDTGNIATAVQLIDDAIFAEDAAHTTGDKGIPAMFVRRDTASSLAGADNDYLPGTTDSAGRLWVNASGAAVPVTDNSGSLTVDGTVTANLNTSQGAAEVLTSGTDNASNDFNELVTAAFGYAFDGTAWDRLRGDSTDGLLVNLGANNDITGTVTANLSATDNAVLDNIDADTSAIQTSVELIDDTVATVSATKLLRVGIFDAADTQITSFGGGTQYTEDAAAAANPVGNILMGVRDDALSGQTSTDGDNIAARMTDKGELYVKHVDAIPVTDNGGALTVDGTVAATQSGTWNVTDISGTVSLPTGASTSAKQDTMITALQLIDDIVYAEDAASANGDKGAMVLAKRLDTPANSSGTDGDYEPLQMSGGRLWVDASGKTLTVGSHAVTNAGTFAVQVDGSALTALQLIDNIVLAEDAAHVSGDSGVQMLAVRKDTGAAIAGTDGDYTPLQVDANGALRVTGGGGGTEYVVDADAPDTPTGTTMVMERDDALSALTPIEGDWVHPRANANGALWVKHDGTMTVDGSGVTQPVSHAALTELAAAIDTEVQVDIVGALPAGTNAIGKLAANSGVDIGDVDVLSIVPGTGATNLGKAEDAAHSTGDVGVMALGIRDDTLSVFSGTEGDYEPFHMTAAGRLYTSATVDAALPAGTNNIGDVDILSIAAGDNNIGNVDIVTMPNVTLAAGTNTNEVVGDAADDAAVAGNPVLTGTSTKNFDGTDPGNVSAENDASFNISDPNRRQYVNTVHPMFWSYHLDTSTAQTDTSVKAAPGANYSLFVTDIVFSSGSATAINLFFEEGASKVLGPYYLEAVAGRGMAVHFTTPKQITANTALTLTTSASIAHSVDVMGFTAKVN